MTPALLISSAFGDRPANHRPSAAYVTAQTASDRLSVNLRAPALRTSRADLPIHPKAWRHWILATLGRGRIPRQRKHHRCWKQDLPFSRQSDYGSGLREQCRRDAHQTNGTPLHQPLLFVTKAERMMQSSG